MNKIVSTLGAVIVAAFALSSTASAVVYEQYPYEVGGELSIDTNSTRADAPRVTGGQDFNRGLYDAH